MVAVYKYSSDPLTTDGFIDLLISEIDSIVMRNDSYQIYVTSKGEKMDYQIDYGNSPNASETEGDPTLKFIYNPIVEFNIIENYYAPIDLENAFETRLKYEIRRENWSDSKIYETKQWGVNLELMVGECGLEESINIDPKLIVIDNSVNLWNNITSGWRTSLFNKEYVIKVNSSDYVGIGLLIGELYYKLAQFDIKSAGPGYIDVGIDEITTEIECEELLRVNIFFYIETETMYCVIDRYFYGLQ
jgi:hypothetical protein